MADQAWYSSQSSQYGTPQQHQQHQHQQPPPPQASSDVTAAQQDARRLVAAYPLANATPTEHGQSSFFYPTIYASQLLTVARHLNPLTVSARAPSYVHPGYYTHQPAANAPPPPYTEYASEIAHLQSSQPSSDPYWSRTRADAVNLLGNQPQYPIYADYQPSTSYWTPSQPAAPYRAPALGHAVLTHTFPHSAYPTPPPPMRPSSSSLAGALGPPPPPITPARPPQLQRPPPAQMQQQHSPPPPVQQQASLPPPPQSSQATYQSQQPVYPSHQPSYHSHQPSYPPQQPSYLPPQPLYPSHHSAYLSGPGIHPPQSSYASHESPYTPQQPPQAHLSRQPSYPSQQAPYPPQQPSYPSRRPSYPSQEPSYPSQEPSYPPQEPSYPSQEPSYPSQPSYPPQPAPPSAPSYPVTPSTAAPAPQAPAPAPVPPLRSPPKPHEQAKFFNAYLASTSREIERERSAKYATMPHPSAHQHRRSALSTVFPSPAAAAASTTPAAPSTSPAPPSSSAATSVPPSSPPPPPSPAVPSSPLKRKAAPDALQSPAVKRIQTLHRVASTPSLGRARDSSVPAAPPDTPSSTASSILGSPKKERARSPSRDSSSTRSLSPAAQRRRQVFVQLPAPRMLFAGAVVKTPTKKRADRAEENMDVDADGGDGDGDGDDGEYLPVVTSLPSPDKPRSKGKKTGERDERDALEKLSSMLEDLFEAEDALFPDMEPSSLSTPFSPHSLSARQPSLHPSTLHRLSQRIAAATASRKSAKKHAGASPMKKRKSGGLADLGSDGLSRALKMLERSVQAAENADPFPSSSSSTVAARGGTPGSVTATPSKKGRTKKEKDASPAPVADLDKISRALEVARDGVLAASCALALLSGDRLPRTVYSEELITSCVAAVRAALERAIYPLAGTSSLASSVPKAVVGELMQAVLGALEGMDRLVRADTISMSEGIAISLSYVAMSPFFASEADGADGGSGGGGAGGKKSREKDKDKGVLGDRAMASLRLAALGLIRSVFGKREDQRAWIIEEVLQSLAKLSDTKQKAGTIRLPNGGTIRTVSALLLQLVQTSAHGVRLQARRLGRARQLRVGDVDDGEDDDEIDLYSTGLESAILSGKTIVAYLTTRAGRNKNTKNSYEAEYRAIFDALLQDLLAVLFAPEWPAAALVLGIACKALVGALADVKTASNVENNAVKAIALDHLGAVAARLRASAMEFSEEEDGLKSLDEIVQSRDLDELDRLIAAHQEVSAQLVRRASEDQSFESARELTAVTWGHELAKALKTLPNNADETLARRLRSALRDVWSEGAHDVFGEGSASAERTARAVGVVQDLRNSYPHMLHVIVAALEAPPVFMRTKALKALGTIVSTDPTVLSEANVSAGIRAHLQDNSAAVREAAVGLIGDYMVSTPKVANEYYPMIAGRIADLGLAVRKRVIKLLRTFYGTNTIDQARRIDICTRLVLRLNDEDDSVKDLTLRTLEELWFPSAQQQSDVRTKVAIIMGVAAQFRERQSPVEDLLHRIAAGKSGAEAEDVNRQYAEVCGSLIDGLVDAESIPGFTIPNCIRTIYLFVSAHPRVLTAANASTLLPYLKNNSSNGDEQAVSDYLLKIFRAAVPHMPKTATKFATELQGTLHPMIVKPSAVGGLVALQEGIACFCAVILHLTNDYKALSKLFVSCFSKVRQMEQLETQGKPVPVTARTALWFIVALICEHCDFDKLRVDHASDMPELDKIGTDSIAQRVYQLYLQLYDRYTDSANRGRILQCLGFLFRAYPTLMTLDPSATIMDSVFTEGAEEDRTRLLRLMQEFLVSESEKHAAKEKGKEKASNQAKAAAGVNMEELIGNTDGFAESGVASAIVQRYLEPVLASALALHPQMQSAAVDILSFTIKQGLAHPLQSFPVIVALETSPNAALATRANGLHAILSTKHASLLNSRYANCARKTYEYQRALATADAPLCGYRQVNGSMAPIALLQRWYTHVREKRTPKIDFLKALIRALEPPSSLQVTQDDAAFVRYMAENFASMEYKLTEEVLLVGKLLIGVLSTLGMQCLHSLQPEGLTGLLDEPIAAPTAGPDADMVNGTSSLQQQADNDSWKTLEKLPLLRSSVVFSIIMLLKAHLKALYGLSEEKLVKYVLGKKSAVGDRAATRKQTQPVAISWDRLPYAVAPILTLEDMQRQRDAFLAIWHQDGVSAEPEEDPL